MRVARMWNDTDESFHRRANRVLRDELSSLSLPDMDVLILSRMYDYVGHLLRSIDRNPEHLTSHLIMFRDIDWKIAMTVVAGHQGHSGRVAPWNLEFQYHAYFWQHEMHWKAAAMNKETWQKHRKPWIKHMLRGRSDSSRFGKF